MMLRSDRRSMMLGSLASLIVGRAVVGGHPALAESSAPGGGVPSLESWIPASVRGEIANGTYQGDAAPFINQALRSGEDIKLDRGTYPIRSPLTLQRPGQSLSGSSTQGTTISVDERFDLSASGIVKMQHLASVRRLRIACTQPSTRDRAGLIRYPAAFDLTTATNADLSDLVIERCVDGFRGISNCGGTTFENIRIGAFGRAFVIDGALDFVKFNAIHVWPYGIAGDPNWLAIYQDGETVALELGQCEQYAIANFVTFAARVVLRAGANGGIPFGTLANISLDGNGATLEVEAGRHAIGVLSSTKDGAQTTRPATAQTARIRGGDTVIGSVQIDSNGTLDDIAVTGGALQIGGGHIRQHNDRSRSVYVTGGRAEIGRVRFTPHDGFPQRRSVAFVGQDATGVVDIDGAIFPFREGDSGAAVTFGTKEPGNTLRLDGLRGWSIAR